MITDDRICELSGKCKVCMISSVTNFHFISENLSKSHDIFFLNVIEYVKHPRITPTPDGPRFVTFVSDPVSE